MGRVGVDIYPEQIGVPLEDVDTFAKYLGGSATNVAVAAARHGRRSAVITRTGEDAFGRFVHKALAGFGVDDGYVTSVPTCRRRSRSARSSRPTTSPCTSTGPRPPPTSQIRADELDLDAIRDADLFWVTGHRPVPGAEQGGDAGRARGARSQGYHGARPRLPADVLGPPRRGHRAGRPRSRARHRRRRQPRGVRSRRRRDGAGGRGRGTPGPRRPGGDRQAGARRASTPWTTTDRSTYRRSQSRWSTASGQATPSAARSATACSLDGSWLGPSGSPMRPARSSQASWRARTRCRRRVRSTPFSGRFSMPTT